jgi:hypothetical protein
MTYSWLTSSSPRLDSNRIRDPSGDHTGLALLMPSAVSGRESPVRLSNSHNRVVAWSFFRSLVATATTVCAPSGDTAGADRRFSSHIVPALSGCLPPAAGAAVVCASNAPLKNSASRLAIRIRIIVIAPH